MQLVAVIPITPVPKGRARTVRRRDGATLTFTPAETVAAEDAVRAHWLVQHPRRAVPLAWFRDAPLRLTVDAFLPRPRTVKRKRPTARPDGSNILKLVEDGLNTVAYRDDTQLTDTRCRKWYADPPDTTPRLIITLEDDYGPG